jgi:hypothetical protein
MICLGHVVCRTPRLRLNNVKLLVLENVGDGGIGGKSVRSCSDFAALNCLLKSTEFPYFELDSACANST